MTVALFLMVFISIIGHVQGQVKSFSCAISSMTLNPGDAPFSVCNYTAASTVGSAITLQWFTGDFGDTTGNGCENVQVSIHIDGEIEPSLQFFPYELTGVPSLEAYGNISNEISKTRVWSSALFGRYSSTSWNSNMAIPFSSSVSITLQFLPVDSSSGGVSIYYQAHGIDGIIPSFGSLPLPANARLTMQRNDLVMDPLEYLSVVNVEAGKSAYIAGLALAVSNTPNMNTLEGCFHLYETAATTYPGILHSTGTEDEFLSSYYFDRGAFQERSAGLFYITNHHASMYRSKCDYLLLLCMFITPAPHLNLIIQLSIFFFSL